MKGIFIWEHDSILAGNPDAIAAELKAGGFTEAYLHSVYLSTWASSSRVLLTQKLQAAGIAVYASAAVYGITPQSDGQVAAGFVNRYNLAGFIFDAESGFDAQVTATTNATTMLQAYKTGTSKPAIWCWWPLYQSSSGAMTYHNKAILASAMTVADFGMPMAYWSWGDSAAQAVGYLNEVWRQWRMVTNKPLIVAGRAYIGDGGTPTPDAVRAYESRARMLGAAGVSWWSMQHAILLGDVWNALKALPQSSVSGSGGTTMWSDSTLMVSLYNDDLTKPMAAVDFGALAKAGTEIFGIRMAGATNEGLDAWTDPLYAARYDQAKTTGRMIAGMVKVHPRLDEANSWNSCDNLISTLDITAGSARLPDIFVLVFEVSSYTDFRGLNPYTPQNMKTCVVQNCELLYKKFKRPVLIEMPWGGMKNAFYDPNQKVNLFTEWIGLQDADLVNERFPLIGAYYPSGNFQKPITDLAAWRGTLSYPDGTVESTYLNNGDAKWRGWELAQVVLGGVTFRTILLKDTPDKLYPHLNKTYPGAYTGVVTPPSGGGTGGGNVPPADLAAVIARLDAVEAELAAVKAKLAAVGKALS